MYTINIIEYYINLAITWVSQYVLYLWNEFMGFSPIIKIAAVSVTLSALLIIFTFLRMTYNGIRDIKWKKEYNKMDKKYGTAVRYILSDEVKNNMTRQEILDVLDLDEEERKDKGDILKTFREKFSFCRLVYRCRISEEAALDRRKNLQVLLDIFGVPQFLDEVIGKSSMRRKAEALEMIRAFKLPVNQWIANQLRNAKRFRVRRLTSYASIMTGQNADLEYFESDFFDKNCCLYDEIQFGYVLQRRKAMNRRIPNLAMMANNKKNPSAQAVFVRLMRMFNQKEYCEELEDLFQSTNNKELTQEICRTWGYLGYLPGEQHMKDILLTQPDDTKVHILHALARLKTGRSLEPMVTIYRDSGDQQVRLEALRCMYNYGVEGYQKFKELEKTVSDEDRCLFEFFAHPLTREDTKLSKDDIYETVGDDSLLTVN